MLKKSRAPSKGTLLFSNLKHQSNFLDSPYFEPD